MSFFSRFTNIVSGQSASKPYHKPKPLPKHKPKQAKSVLSPVSKIKLAEIENKAREIIIEAKNKAFDIKKQADTNAQKMIQAASKLKEEALKQRAEFCRRVMISVMFIQISDII